MKKLLILIMLVAGITLGKAKPTELVMSLDDTFAVQDTADWKISVDKLLPLRFADVYVVPKGPKSFSLMLYFKCDMPDLANYDTPEKMKRALVDSSRKYLGGIVEKELVIEEIKYQGWFGFKTKFTDASLVGKKALAEDEFLYMVRGMIRLSKDSALGFSLMTNNLESEETKRVMNYVFSFVKPRTL